MPTSAPAKRVPPITFAHRGARAHAPENTIEAFTLAVRLGASGLESDVWLTSDRVPVLDHDGVVKQGLRKRAIGDVRRADLPAHIPELAELYATCGTDLELSLDVKDPLAAAPTVAVARAAGGDALAKLWLCHHDWEQVAQWRSLDPDVLLVDSTRLRRLKDGPERRAAQLAAAGVNAVNMHVSDWTGGLTTLFHRFDRFVLGWDAQQARQIADLVAISIDGVYSDHVDRLTEVVPAHRT